MELNRDVCICRILKKSSARLKELSMQLKEAGRDSQGDLHTYVFCAAEGPAHL